MSTAKPSLPQAIADRARLVWRLMRDRRVPLYLKVLPIAALLYVLWPLDLLPDLAVSIGQLDDLTVLLLGIEVFIALCPSHVVDEHQAAIANADQSHGDVIEGEWQVRE